MGGVAKKADENWLWKIVKKIDEKGLRQRYAIDLEISDRFIRHQLSSKGLMQVRWEGRVRVRIEI